MDRYTNLIILLETSTRIDSITECWFSLKSINKGRPQVSAGGVSIPAYRLIAEYALNNSERIPSNIVVRHKCDNSHCYNPDHLEFGSISDNNKDRMGI